MALKSKIKPVELIDNKVEEDRDTEIDELLQIVKGPDFPTGGIVEGKEGASFYSI